MNTVNTITELQQFRAHLPSPLGFVPTMGYLHEGHLSLVRTARTACASAVVSIFVNPTQFGPDEDLDAYPRDIERDLNMLESEGVDLVWIPAPEVMYPPDFQTWVIVEKITRPLEGSMRPGHFKGVTTVVAKLFNAVQPQLVYFGQKDAQQAAVIRQMVHDLNFPIEVVVCPTVREHDGLALSSRNTNLNQEQRRAASVLYRALLTAQSAFQSGEVEAENLRQIMRQIVGSEPMASLQYASCAHPNTLEEFEGRIPDRALLSMAVYIGETRLIDNMIISK
jgi:pantoate--beta-alanine ligase